MRRSTYIMGTMIMAGVVLIASVFVFVRCEGVEESPIGGAYLTNETVKYDLPEFESVNLDLRYVYSDDAIGAVHGDAAFPVIFECDDSVENPYMIVPKELVESYNFDIDSTALSITINSTSPYLMNVSESGGIKIAIPRDINVNKIQISDNCRSCDLKIAYINGANMTVECSTNRNQNIDIEHCSWKNFSSLNFNRIEFNDFDADSVSVWACRDTRVVAGDSVEVKNLELTGGTVDFVIDGFKNYDVKPVGDATIGVKQIYKSID